MIQIVNCLNGILAVLEEIAEALTPADSNEAKTEQRDEKSAEEPVTEEPAEEPVTKAKVTRTKKEVV